MIVSLHKRVVVSPSNTRCASGSAQRAVKVAAVIVDLVVKVVEVTV